MAKRLLVSFFLTVLTVIIEICAVVPLASNNWLFNGDFKCGLMKFCNFSVSSTETCQNLEEKLPSEKDSIWMCIGILIVACIVNGISICIFASFVCYLMRCKDTTVRSIRIVYGIVCILYFLGGALISMSIGIYTNSVVLRFPSQDKHYGWAFYMEYFDVGLIIVAAIASGGLANTIMNENKVEPESSVTINKKKLTL